MPCQGNTWRPLEQAQEDTSPEKINVTSKFPVGNISVVTLIRTDTTLDHSQKAEKVWSNIYRERKVCKKIDVHVAAISNSLCLQNLTPCSWITKTELLQAAPLQRCSSQRSLHDAPIFRLLLKVAVNGTHQCDFLNFCGPFKVQQTEVSCSHTDATKRKSNQNFFLLEYLVGESKQLLAEARKLSAS